MLFSVPTVLQTKTRRVQTTDVLLSSSGGMTVYEDEIIYSASEVVSSSQIEKEYIWHGPSIQMVWIDQKFQEVAYDVSMCLMF